MSVTPDVNNPKYIFNYGVLKLLVGNSKRGIGKLEPCLCAIKKHFEVLNLVLTALLFSVL